jgi:hypothetical protein
VVNPGAAPWTECAELCSARIGFRHVGFQFALRKLESKILPWSIIVDIQLNPLEFIYRI